MMVVSFLLFGRINRHLMRKKSYWYQSGSVNIVYCLCIQFNFRTLICKMICASFIHFAIVSILSEIFPISLYHSPDVVFF